MLFQAIDGRGQKTCSNLLTISICESRKGSLIPSNTIATRVRIGFNQLHLNRLARGKLKNPVNPLAYVMALTVE